MQQSLGASAISQYAGLLVQNEKHVGRYRLRAANGGLAGVRGIARAADDRLRGTVIERLLCDETVDLAEIAAHHAMPVAPLAAVLPNLAPLAARGLVGIRGTRLTLLPAGRPYGRVVAAYFDRHRAPQAQRFSRAI
ncbi:hypothetical protein [Sphingomonas sp. UYP23]